MMGHRIIQVPGVTCDYGSGNAKPSGSAITARQGLVFPKFLTMAAIRTRSHGRAMGTGLWASMSHAFNGCSNLTMTATDYPNLASVTDMSSMFQLASSINSNITRWDTSNVEDMVIFFQQQPPSMAISLAGILGNVTDMSYMYYGSARWPYNRDISG